MKLQKKTKIWRDLQVIPPICLVRSMFFHLPSINRNYLVVKIFLVSESGSFLTFERDKSEDKTLKY